LPLLCIPLPPFRLKTTVTSEFFGSWVTAGALEGGSLGALDELELDELPDASLETPSLAKAAILKAETQKAAIRVSTMYFLAFLPILLIVPFPFSHEKYFYHTTKSAVHATEKDRCSARKKRAGNPRPGKPRSNW
jgi:hypothetical protein